MRRTTTSAIRRATTVGLGTVLSLGALTALAAPASADASSPPTETACQHVARARPSISGIVRTFGVIRWR